MESATRNHSRPVGRTVPAAASFASTRRSSPDGSARHPTNRAAVRAALRRGLLTALLPALVSATPGAAGAAPSLGTAGAPPPNVPGMVRVTVEVELTCPSCAQGLERRLGRLDHVAGVEVRPVDGRIVLSVEPGRRLELAAVHDTVRNAGFIPDRVVVTAVGRLILANDAPALALSPDFAIPLVPAARAAGLMTEVGGRLAQVSGHWDPVPDGPGALRVGSFEVIR